MIPKFHGPMEPVHPCRFMPTRHVMTRLAPDMPNRRPYVRILNNEDPVIRAGVAALRKALETAPLSLPQLHPELSFEDIVEVVFWAIKPLFDMRDYHTEILGDPE